MAFPRIETIAWYYNTLKWNIEHLPIETRLERELVYCMDAISLLEALYYSVLINTAPRHI